jgi:hypothetical protein
MAFLSTYERFDLSLMPQHADEADYLKKTTCIDIAGTGFSPFSPGFPLCAYPCKAIYVSPEQGAFVILQFPNQKRKNMYPK